MKDANATRPARRRGGESRPAPWHGEVSGHARPDVLEYIAAGPVRLRAAIWAGRGRGHVVLLPGRTEYLEKYAPIVAELTSRGFEVASLDWRGQGASDRDADVELLGHVGDFSEYQEDLDALLSWAESRGSLTGRRVMVAHSMGGCIGLRAMLDGALSGEDRRVDAAIFSAPMWGLALPTGGAALARILARLGVRFGAGRRRARGPHRETTYVLDNAFDGNVLVQDPAVWARFRKEAQARQELTLASPTLSWLDAAFREMSALEASDGAGLPPRLLLLGSAEAVVSPGAIRAHAARGDGAELVELADARHEPLMEPPGGRIGRDAWGAIDAFLRARAL